MGLDFAVIGPVIRGDREHLGLRQDEYAELLGLTQTQISRIERNQMERPSAAVVDAIRARLAIIQPEALGEPTSRDARRGEKSVAAALSLLLSSASETARAEMEQLVDDQLELVSDTNGRKVFSALALIYKARKVNPEAWAGVAMLIQGIALGAGLSTPTETKKSSAADVPRQRRPRSSP